MITKQELKSLLQDNIVSVSFEKKDGTRRDMLCTLKKDYLPVVEHKEVKRTKAENPDILPVWDMEKEGFRSVRMNALLGYHMCNFNEPYEL
tara:strand:- start:318 stop:590 length:273 start_codon:yes stop_codon:yes gene_type:complete